MSVSSPLFFPTPNCGIVFIMIVLQYAPKHYKNPLQKPLNYSVSQSLYTRISFIIIITWMLNASIYRRSFTNVHFWTKIKFLNAAKCRLGSWGQRFHGRALVEVCGVKLQKNFRLFKAEGLINSLKRRNFTR